MNDISPSIGHNRALISDAEELLEAFERAPETLDAETAEAAITLAKQMKLAADDLASSRKAAAEPLRAEIALLEAPYKDATERLEKARAGLIGRLAAYLDGMGKDAMRTSLGLTVYRKRSVGFEVEDAKKLPRKFLVPDTARIEHAIRSGEEVPGVRIVEKITTVVV